MRALLTLLVLGCLVSLGACGRPAPAAKRDEKVVRLVATTEIRGTPEPCGCQSDPLGDVSRVAALARGGLWLDGGGLRFASVEVPIPTAAKGQAELKARFLEQALAEQRAVVGLGNEDLYPGREVKLGIGGARDRVCANASGLDGARPRVVREVAGVRVGIFGVVDEEYAAAMKPIALSPSTEAARAQVAALRSEGAQIVVALAHLSRVKAQALVRAVPGIQVVVVGDEVGEEGGLPQRIGETLLVQPAQEAMRAAKVELHVVDGRVSTEKFDDAADVARELEQLKRKIAENDALLARLRGDHTADPEFLKTREKRGAALAEQRAALERPRTPPTGAYLTASLVPIQRRLPRDEKLEAAMKRLDAEVGEANRAAGEKVPAPAAPKGQPHFSGIGECGDCHSAAVAFWKKTVHATAWQELVTKNKQWSFDCIGCHVTGYGQAGGSAMAHVDGLTDVQCESCHGPGSQHADAPKKVRLRFPSESDCKICHTKDHSDTFRYEPYLRDVLGPGHGEKRRAELGDGPTGHELRHAAEAASGRK